AQVADPWMRHFVETERGAAQFVILRRDGSEEDRVFAQEGRARVLHAAVSEARNQHLIVLCERERLIEELDHMLHPFARQPFDFGPFLLRALKLRLANEDTQWNCTAFARDLFERPGGEREQIRADRLCLMEEPN